MLLMKDEVTLKTSEQHAIHALNIHGIFFERKCQEVVRNANGWHIQETNYPVEYHSEVSNLDIWAESEEHVTRIELPIECKKNNQDFVDWIFFPQPTHRPVNSLFQMIQVRNTSTGNAWKTNREFRWLEHNLVIADEGRETKGDYLKIKQRQDWTKTSNTAITDAARQITLATQALIEQEYRVLEELKGINQKQNISGTPPYYQLLFFPTIVTNAQLFTCQFQDADVDLSTGEIPPDKAVLLPCPYLMFDYPVPVALQRKPQDMGEEYTRKALRKTARMSIFVVQSKSLPAFLSQLQLVQEFKDDLDRSSYKLHFGMDIPTRANTEVN